MDVRCRLKQETWEMGRWRAATSDVERSMLASALSYRACSMMVVVMMLWSLTGCTGWGGAGTADPTPGASIPSPLLGRYHFTPPPSRTPTGTLVFSSTQFPAVANPLFAA